MHELVGWKGNWHVNSSILLVSFGFLVWQFALWCVGWTNARELRLQRASARWARPGSGPGNFLG